jgi:L-gulonate 5-dehydrogenase
MRQLVTIGPGQLAFRDAPEPVPGPDEALLAVEAVGICGSDLHLYAGDHPYARFPTVQGHEFGGRVLALPPGYEGPVRVGQRVAVEPLLVCGECLPCRRGRRNCCVRMRTYGVHLDGALSERIAVRAGLLHEAEGLPPELVVLVETTSIALQATRRGSVAAGDTVVVLGAGPVGLAVAVAATDRGARVLAVDTLATRLELARGLGVERTARAGADDVTAAVADWTGGDGPTVVVEATGVPAVLEQAVGMVAPSGTVVVVGLSSDRVSFPMLELTRKELTIVGSRNSVGAFADAVDLVRREHPRLARLVTHRFPIEQGAEAFELAHHEPGRVGKVVIDVAQHTGGGP